MDESRYRVALDLSCVYEQPRTGVGYAGLHLARALLARMSGIDFRLFATRPRNVPARLPELGLPFSRETVLPYARRLKRMLWTTLEWPPIECFTGNVHIAHDLFHQLPATRRARRMVTVHDLSFFRHPDMHTEETVRQHTHLLRHIARSAHACVAISHSCKNDMIEFLAMDSDRIHVVPCGVETADFEDPLDATQLKNLQDRLRIGPRYFIHLGTIEPRKNLPRLIEAHAHLFARRRDCPKLLLVGKIGWKAATALQAIQDAGASGRLIHAGYLSRFDAVSLLRGAVACVYPSLYEGFGLPALEAMAARVPLITSNVSALPEVVGDTAVQISPDNLEELEDAMESVLENHESTRLRVQRAHARALEMTWARRAIQLEAIYDMEYSNYRA